MINLELTIAQNQLNKGCKNMDIGEIIKEGRQKMRLTQHKLAEKLEVDPSTISRWENNEKIPSGDTIIKLAKILDIVSLLFPGYDKATQASEIPDEVQQQLEKLWQDNEKLWQVVRLLERTMQERKNQRVAVERE